MFQRHMANIYKAMEKFVANQSGISIIAMAFFIMGLGLLFAAGSQIYDVWKRYENPTITADKIEILEDALAHYIVNHDRYPCPAPLDAAVDTADFGMEVGNNVAGNDYKDCITPGGDFDGTFEATNGRDGRHVRTGAVPVRTLGLEDNFAFDGQRQRFIYTVTENYTLHTDAIMNQDLGAIFIEDSAGNSATETPGNIVHLIYSMGMDNNGAYGLNGNLISPCDTNALSGENCNFNTDALFLNTVNKSDNQSNNNAFFVHQMAYKPSDNSCDSSGSGIQKPKDVSFLLDTSGSMSSPPSQCPASLGPWCSRMDLAHWAIRRAMPARIHNSYNEAEDESRGKTNFTGFLGSGGAHSVKNNITAMGNTFTVDNQDTTSNPGYTYDEDTVADNVENRLKTMCPGGGTPLGMHIDALAQNLNAEDESNGVATADMAFRKIVIISDGKNTKGESPIAVAKRLKDLNPNVQVDIIDVIGTGTYCYDYDDDTSNDCTPAQKAHGMRQVVEQSEGHYYPAQDPDALLDALYKSFGICAGAGGVTLPEPANDPIYCP